jgi:DNA-binding transcriptional LysR family regulator
MHSVFLRYLDEVARQGSIRKAASVLNVSSTSVNRKIINIEDRLASGCSNARPKASS